jgi:hypothetical protein
MKRPEQPQHRYVGIDPDTDKSGVAIIDQTGQLYLHNMTFFELFGTLKFATIQPYPLTVVIEAGWLNTKSNWHKQGSGERLVSKIAKNTGANHETGRKIVEMCEYLGVKYELVQPKRSKVDSKFFEALTGIKRTNQEQRDAAMLIIQHYDLCRR